MIKYKDKLFITNQELIQALGVSRESLCYWRKIGLPSISMYNKVYYPYREARLWILAYRNIDIGEFFREVANVILYN